MFRGGHTPVPLSKTNANDFCFKLTPPAPISFSLPPPPPPPPPSPKRNMLHGPCELITKKLILTLTHATEFPLDNRQPSKALKFNRQTSKWTKFNRQPSKLHAHWEPRWLPSRENSRRADVKSKGFTDESFESFSIIQFLHSTPLFPRIC